MKIRQSNEVPKSLKTINIKAILRKRGVYDLQKENKLLKEAALPLAKGLIKKPKKTEIIQPEVKSENRHSQFTNQELETYWQKQIHIVDTIEKQFENKLEQFINGVKDKFLLHFDQEITNKKVYKDYFSDNEEDLLVQADFDFTPLLRDVAILSGNEANKLIGKSEPYMPFNYEDQIKDNVNKFTQSMLSTDREALSNLITSGLKDGKSIPEIRSSIQDTFGSFSKNQAQRITRTEVLRASNQASIDAYEQSGVVEGKQWLTAGASDECAQYEGQIVTLRDSFYGSDSEFQDGDPPLHPNCRCVVVPVVEDAFNEGSTVYHGSGGEPTSRSPMLGEGFYVSRSEDTAQMFGDVNEYTMPFTDKDIFLIRSDSEYEKFIDDVIHKYPTIDINKAIPKYIKSLGYKAAEVSDNVDPLGGIAIYYKKDMPSLKKNDIDYLKKRIKKLERETNDSKAYIKSLEKLLNE